MKHNVLMALDAGSDCASSRLSRSDAEARVCVLDCGVMMKSERREHPVIRAALRG